MYIHIILLNVRLLNVRLNEYLSELYFLLDPKPAPLRKLQRRSTGKPAPECMLLLT